MDAIYLAARERLKVLINEEPHETKIANIAKGVDQRCKTERDKLWLSPKRWTCLIPGCTKHTIGSHTLQANGTLAVLGEPGKMANSSHVITPQWSPFTEGALNRSDVSINEASKFPGFCQEHDTAIFLPLEKPGVTLNGETRLLQAYRSFCREARLHQHLLVSMDDAYEKRREAERQYLADMLIEQIPQEYRARYSGLKTIKIAFNDELYERFRFQRDAQEYFVEAFGLLAETFDRYLVEGRAPEISAWFFTLAGDLPYAMSGSDDISTKFGEPIPIFYFVMPMGGVTEIGIFTAAKNATHLRSLLDDAGVAKSQGEDGAHPIIDLCEQLLFDRTDHWFMRPSSWHSLSKEARDVLTARTWESGNTVWKPPATTVFPTFRSLVLKAHQHYHEGVFI